MAARSDFEIGSERVAPGTRRTLNLPVSVLSDHTPVSLSLHVVHGQRPGPTVFISAGIHGDEIIGLEIVRRLLRAPNIENLKGTLIVIPVVNTFGFINHSRYLPDRRDLNRCFPGSEKGSLASRLAYIFTNEIVSRAELGIDLHSAAIHRINFPQVRVAPDNPVTQELAQVFGAPVILEAGLRDGSLRATARSMGNNVLLFEGGEGLRFDEFSVRVGLMGILRVLRHLEMIPAKGVPKPRQAPQYCASSKWIRSPIGGLLRNFRKDGDLVKEGDVLGSVTDPFGEREAELTAPFDGVIIGRVVMPVVNEGDAAFHLARVKSVRNAGDAMESLTAQIADDPMFDEDEIL